MAAQTEYTVECSKCKQKEILTKKQLMEVRTLGILLSKCCLRRARVTRAMVLKADLLVPTSY